MVSPTPRQLLFDLTKSVLAQVSAFVPRAARQGVRCLPPHTGGSAHELGTSCSTELRARWRGFSVGELCVGVTNYRRLKMEESEQNKKQYDALELLYTDSIENIRLYKQQQFSITNYAIATYVAIVALFDRLKNPTDFEKGLLTSVAIVVFTVGTALIFSFHCSMVGSRKRMAKIRESFDDRSKEAWNAHDKPDHASCRHNIVIAITLTGVLLLGALAVWWTIYTSGCGK